MKDTERLDTQLSEAFTSYGSTLQLHTIGLILLGILRTLNEGNHD